MHHRPLAPTVATALGLCLGIVSGCGAPVERSSDERLGETQSAAVVCAAGEEHEGIDVSQYQTTVDWPAVAADGIVFAVARVNHGTVMDEEFATNWAGMKDNGLVRGAYQYFDPGGDPIWQANVLIDEVGLLGPGDLPAVIDVESTDDQPPSVIADNVRTWLELVEAGTGRRPLIYTARYFWDAEVVTSEFAEEGYPLWVANWTTGCPDLPSPWSDWAIWQYTATGSVAGISGDVDRDRFNGSMLELQDWAANGYRAEVVALSYPQELRIGETGTAALTVRNVGARSWPTETWLGTTEPRDRTSPFVAPAWPDSSRAAALEDPLAPGETTTLEFALRAPSVADTYVEHFNLVVDGTTWFSDINPGGGPLDDEIELRIEVQSATGGGGSGGTGASGTGADETAGASGIPGSGGSCSLARVPRRQGTDGSGWHSLALWLGLACWRHRRRGHRTQFEVVASGGVRLALSTRHGSATPAQPQPFPPPSANNAS